MVSVVEAEAALFSGDLALAGFVDDSPRACWLRAVGLGAQGYYTRGWAELDSCLSIDDHALDADVSLAASAAASFHRQLGRHLTAAMLDEYALALALRTPRNAHALEAELDALVGLAADSVGVGDVAAATRWLARAAALGSSAWRAQVRLAWVRAEVALLGGVAHEAGPAADQAVAISREVGAMRHLAKSLLFTAVSRPAGDPESARAAYESLEVATAIGARTLLWPARIVLSSLEPVKAGVHAHNAAAVIRSIAADTPPEIARGWLQGPDLALVLREDA